MMNPVVRQNATRIKFTEAHQHEALVMQSLKLEGQRVLS
jgi:hypothetical protein